MTGIVDSRRRKRYAYMVSPHSRVCPETSPYSLVIFHRKGTDAAMTPLTFLR